MKLALLTIATLCLLAIAGMMGKDQYDKYQYAKAVERQQSLERLEEGCLRPDPPATTDAARKFQQTICEIYRRALMGEE